MEGVQVKKNARLEKIIVQNVPQIINYAKNAKIIFIRMKMVDVLI